MICNLQFIRKKKKRKEKNGEKKQKGNMISYRRKAYKFFALFVHKRCLEEEKLRKT